MEFSPPGPTVMSFTHASFDGGLIAWPTIMLFTCACTVRLWPAHAESSVMLCSHAQLDGEPFTLGPHTAHITSQSVDLVDAVGLFYSYQV